MLLWMLWSCVDGEGPEPTASVVESAADTASTDQATETQLETEHSEAHSSASASTETEDTAGPCLVGTVGVEEAAQDHVDGARNSSDGLSGTLALGLDAHGTVSAWVHGRSATLPDGTPADGVVSIYAGLASVSARIYADPAEGELDALAVADLDGDGASDAAVSIEHAGLQGARVGVHTRAGGKVPAEDGAVLFTSTAIGASPPLATGDADGDGQAELFIGWAEQVEVWQGPLATGSYVEGDGDQGLTGKTRLWMASEDVDGDGYAELVLPRKTTGDLAVLLGAATGYTADLDAPDQVLSAAGDPGADDGGIRLADVTGDGEVDIVATTVAVAAGDPVVWIWSGLDDDDPVSLSTDETGRYAAATADIDGDGVAEVVLSRFAYTGASGGLLVYSALDVSPLHIAPDTDSLLGASLGDGLDLDGDGRDELVTVDPWGAGEADPRLWVLELCPD